MIISQDVIEMPKANVTIPVSLDDGNVVIVECAKYSKSCELGRMVQAHKSGLCAGVSNKSGVAKHVDLIATDGKMSAFRLYNLTIATCKNCVARRVARKQK